MKEVPLLHCGISLLTNFESSSVWDWQVGTHGIIIDFIDPKGKKRNATYLPEVALEQGWDKMQTLCSLIEKAGYKERISQDMFQSISLTRYQSSKEKLSYEDYASWKSDQEEHQEKEGSD